MKLREVALWPPVRDWLVRQGFKVYPEAFRHDVLAVRGREIWVVELKVSNLRAAVNQTYRAMHYAKRWVALPTHPTAESMEYARRAGVGVLRVLVTGAAVLVLASPEAMAREYITESSITKRLKRLEKYVHKEGAQAGLPTLKGSGPAQAVAKEVLAYKAKRPDATWAEVYDNVHNHYAHVNSMRQSLCKMLSLLESH